MELTVLGANGTYPDRGGACSGYLLRHEGFSMWMDAGNGTMGRLQEHVEVDRVGAVFLSHLHPDHCADLYPYFYALSFHPDRPRGVPLFGPAGAQETLARLLSADALRDFGEVFAWRTLAAGDEVEVGPFRMRVFPSRHTVENLTVRVEGGGKALCYSGDTGPNPDLARAAEGVDLFLCEASWQEGDKPTLPPIHLRAKEAGAAARAAGAGRLGLTHIWPRHDLETSRGEASEEFPGAVDLAVRTDGWSV